MAFPPSPLPSRGKTEFIDLIEDSDSNDELCDDGRRYSPSPYFTQPTQVVGRTSLKPQTQATQIVSRTSLKSPPPPLSSSPRSIIEVPASSPFQPKQQPQAGRLAHFMAPPGTFFRAPPRNPSAGQKRSHSLLSDEENDEALRRPRYARQDSSDDDKPPRGDIQPSLFQSRQPGKPAASPAAKKGTSTNTSTSADSKELPSAHDRLMQSRVHQLAGKVFKQAKGKRSHEQCRDALLKFKCNTMRALEYLMREGSPGPSSPNVKKFAPATTSPSPQSSPQKSNHSTPKPVRRGRLVQGRRNPRPALRDSSPLGPDPLSQPTQIVDLVSDDENDDDEFKSNIHLPSSQGNEDPERTAFSDRVLSYLNNCNAVQLMAIANIKADNAGVMLKHQPFSSLGEARHVVVTKKASRRKVSKISLGEDVVDAIENYARALDGIDHIVGVCEEQGEAISRATSQWKLDFTGKAKGGEDGKDGPPTPTSLSSSSSGQNLALPISTEPRFMQGHCSMKPYQIYGLNWMFLLYERDFGGILADDMGLGKTCQVISLVAAVIEDFENSDLDDENRPWPNLIVVPPSTLSNWEAEFEKFAPDLNVVSYCGNQDTRDSIAEDILESPGDYHVILTTYSQLGRNEDIENLRAVRPMIAVFDEGHKLKNPKTKLYKDLIRITASWRLLLTGTPVQNNLMEMVALLRFVEPELFRDHFDDLEALFNQKVSLQDVSNGALLYSERVARARSILEPFILQRRKEQVLMSLPPKTNKLVYCDLDENQRGIYDKFERRFKRGRLAGAPAPAPTPGPEEATSKDAENNVWMQLRKSAIHPQLFRRWFDDDKVAKMADILMRKIDQSVLLQDNLGHLIAELKNCSDFELHLWCRDYKCIRQFDIPELSFMQSGKVQKLLELVREYERNGDKVLVFTRFAKVIEILRECFATQGVDYVALQGNTNVGDRQELIDQFQSDPSITAFLLTTGAGGTGINLTAANKVVIFDQSDNPQDDVQAENRAHRLGQTRPVEIIKLISKDTIEELVHAACEKKIELANRVTGWEGGNAGMTSGEMEEAIRKELMARDNITPPSSD